MYQYIIDMLSYQQTSECEYVNIILVSNEVPNQGLWLTVKCRILLWAELSYVSCIHHNRNTALPLLTVTTAKPLIIYILESCECPWGTLSLSPSPSLLSLPLLRSLSFESTHTSASTHSNDRLMNLNRRGFRCLDSIGKKYWCIFSWHPT